MKKIALFVVLAAFSAASLAASSGPEHAATGAMLDFARLSAFRPAVPNTLVFQSAVTSSDLEKLYDTGRKPSVDDLAGWYAGRRFTAQGPVAALLVGSNVLKDPVYGPLEGVTLKVTIIGADKPGDSSPASYYDELGSEATNNLIWLLRDKGAEWRAVRFTGTGAIAHDGEMTAEVRKNGAYLLAKYAAGDFAYFFKKVRSE